jgi:hypothetical protein
VAELPDSARGVGGHGSTGGAAALAPEHDRTRTESQEAGA